MNDIGKSTRKDVKWLDTIVRKLIEGVTAHDEKYVVEFKSGIEIDVRL